MNKTDQLQIRVSPADKARIRARADEAGMTVSNWVLTRLFPPAEEKFQAAFRALAENPGKRSYALAAIHDLLAGLTGEQLTEALHRPPEAGLSPLDANYVCAMIEYACLSLNGVAPPAWTRDVPPLKEPWFANSFRSAPMRLYLLTRSPPPYRRRNLFVDSVPGDRV